MAKRVAVSDLTYHHEPYLEHLVLTPARTTESRDVPPPKKLRCYYVSASQLHIPFKFYDKVHQKVSFPNAKTWPAPQNRTWNFTGTLREHQFPIVDECLTQLREHRSTTLWLYPGCGKTAMGAYLGSQLPRDRQLLVVICRKALIESWTETFRQFTNATVYVVPTGAIHSTEITETDVIICMNSRQHKMPDHIRHNIGTFILDEAHMFCETQARIEGVLDIVCDHVILETATYTRLSKMHRFLDLVSGLHYVRRDYPHPFTINKIMVKMPVTIHVPDKGNIMDIYRHLLISRPEYNQVIIDRIRVHSGKVLVMTWLVEHVQLLSQLCTRAGIDHAVFYGNKDSYIDRQVIIATLHKTGVGFDEIFKVIDYNGNRISTVILPLTIKDPNFFLQCLGRGMRADNPIFDVMVHDHNIARKHWAYNHAIVRELPGFNLKSLTITP